MSVDCSAACRGVQHLKHTCYLQEFWRRYEVLPFSRSPEKYMRTPPDTLVDIIYSQLLQSVGAKDASGADVSVRPDRPGP